MSIINIKDYQREIQRKQNTGKHKGHYDIFKTFHNYNKKKQIIERGIQ